MDTSGRGRSGSNHAIHRERLAPFRQFDVLHAIGRLEDFPQSGRIVPEKNDPQIRDIILGNYRIVYRVRGTIVELLTIHYSARLLDMGDLP